MKLETREMMEHSIAQLDLAIALEKTDLAADHAKHDALSDALNYAVKNSWDSNNTAVILQEQLVLTHRIRRREDVIKRWVEHYNVLDARLKGNEPKENTDETGTESLRD